MTALFSKPKIPKPPKLSDAEIEEERRRQLALQKAGGTSGTILTSGSGGAGVGAQLAGQASTLLGGL